MTLGERWRRFVCSTFGHRWIGEQRATPVIPLFAVCKRCGVWRRV